jgi:cytochrome c oxidase assembly factor 7
MPGVSGLYDLKEEDQVKEYLNRVGVEYRFQCYSEKRPDGCHRLADYLEAFKHDYAKARSVYSMNCTGNHYGKSCFKLGHYDLLGRACSKDTTAAFTNYSLGCDYGHAPSCHNAALLLQSGELTDGKKDFVRAAEFLKRGCDGGDPPACQLLSTYYITGKDGVDRDMQLAFKFGLEACQRDHMYACANVGRMYSRGEGIEKNEVLAAEYRQKAQNLFKSVTEVEREIKFSE